ncbi:uncharacterized protein LOC111695040 isoform X3 [Eurytemora carolleeae]|uniref:uncharacterized protein LOC111695040 isoform X3 n=1 Tax=Eurytemora carolleeae TaxID=1294199 RepID=UPI000C78E735|nr:uncharacterized protein LOC111695040 isoform X3 [Eurytemora carolleeae]|eukprot:XP_023319956.1 uncharacterized protein LOC111695040 isoform X3 [Eurytemora affinis]
MQEFNREISFVQSSVVYMIDKKIFLFLSPILHTLNFDLQLGDSVSILNSHIVKFRARKALVLCGRSYLFVNDDSGPANIGDKSSMLSTGNYAISVHPLLSLVAEYSLSLEDFFKLFENYERLKTKFSQIYARKYSLKKLLFKTIKHQDALSKRSLLKEFLLHSTSCGFENLTDTTKVYRVVEVKEMIEYLKNREEEENEEKENKEEIENCFRTEYLDQNLDIKLFGVIRSNADKTLLSDGVDTVEVLITLTSLQEDLEQCLVEVTRPILCSEKYPQPNSYLIIKNIKRLANAVDFSDKIANLCKELTSATVLSPPPSPLTSSLEFKILCKSMIFKQRKGSYFLLQVSSEEGMILVKMTNLMFYKRCQVHGVLTILSDEPFKMVTGSLTSEVVLQLSEEFSCQQVYEINQDVVYNVSAPELVHPDPEMQIDQLHTCFQGEIINISGLISSRTLIHDSSPPTLVLQLVQNVNKVNVYIKTGFQLPVGLVPGTLWKLSNVMKVVSKKENIYLVTGVLSNLEFMGVEDVDLEQSVLYMDRRLGCIKALLEGTEIISEIIISIEDILRINIRVECGSCGSGVEKGVCSYVGCNAPDSFNFSCSSCVEVQDGTGASLLLSSNLEHLPVLLNLSAEDSCSLREKIKYQGELVYSKHRKQNSDKTMEKFVHQSLRNQFFLQARVRRYICREEVKLYCLFVNKLSCTAANTIYEAALEDLRNPF